MCHEINKLLKESEIKDWQIILAVMNDDNDRYTRLMSKGIVSNGIDTSELVLKK